MREPCPDTTDLRRIVAEFSTSSEWPDWLADHVDVCPDCQGVIDATSVRTGIPSPSQEAPPAEVPGYLLLGEIGRGGSGRVFRARHLLLDRTVALKLVPGGLLDGDACPGVALREARAAAAVNHSAVVRVYEVGAVGGWVYVAMHLVEGGTLADRLRTGPLPARAAVVLIESVARTMHEIHQREIVHLDLKPANILLDGPRETPPSACVPLVADFGIALRTNGADGPAFPRFRGTPSYMPPEQFRGTVGVTSDVYSLGATLYHLLTGRPPFCGESPLEAVRLVTTSEPDPPRQLVPGIGRDLETIVLKCLRKDPSLRYPTAEALAEDLRRYREGHAVLARRTPLPGRILRWCRRYPAPTALIVSSLLTIVVVAGLWRRAEHLRAQAQAGEQATISFLWLPPEHDDLLETLDVRSPASPWFPVVMGRVNDMEVARSDDLSSTQQGDRWKTEPERRMRPLYRYFGRLSGKPMVWECRFAIGLAIHATSRRIRGDMDGAERLIALTQIELENLRPTHAGLPEYHVAMSEFWTQVGKQQTRGSDRSATRRAYHDAVGAARSVLRLDANYPGAKELLAEREARLRRFEQGEAKDAAR